MEKLVFVMLVGCAVPVESSQDMQAMQIDLAQKPSSDGARLKISKTKLVGADGSTVMLPDVIHDSLFDVDCTFQEVYGQWRCFPKFAIIETGNWFLDTSCTQRFAYTTYCDGDLKFASSRHCFWEEVYSVQAIKEMVNDVYSVLEDGRCVASMNPYAGFGFQFFQVGTEVKQTEFAQAKQVLQ